MHQLRMSALGVLTLAMLASACGSQQSGSAAPSANAWAMVDGREITRDEVEKAYRRVAEPGATPSEEEALAAKLSVLNELIVQDILIAKARELKLEVTDTELDNAFAEAKQNMPDEAFNQELAKRNLSAGDMRQGLRRELLVQKVIEREVLSKINVTDEDITEFYNANRAQFNLAEDAYRIAQIVITPVGDPQLNNRTGDDAATPAEAAKKAQMLMARVKEGVAFDELARDFSEDPQTAPRGGDLGLVPLSALKQAPPPLRDAVLNSEPGSVRTVSEGGAHTLVMLVAHLPAGQRDLSTPGVRDNITATLRGRKEELLRTAYLTAVRTDAEVVNYFARSLVESQGRPPSLAPTPQ